MKLALTLFLLLPCASMAQYTREYVFVAPARDTVSTGTSSAYGAGLGVERMIQKWFGAGAELGGVVPGRGKANQASGSFSFNGYAHPLLNSKWDPYVTGGYSFLFRDFASNGFNMGAGLNYWYSDNRAFMLEIHELAGNKDPAFPEHRYLEFRIGLSFR